jgi:S-formylglutathione hydrolase FrmB
MAFIRCDFSSASLMRSVNINITIPQNIPLEKRKIMYLLGGLSDDNTMWCRRTNIERYAEEHSVMVVMPNGERSFYTDAVNGEKFWTFVAEELPNVIGSLFNYHPARKNTFAAGLSMGGYGAIKLGLRCPEKFAAVAGLSSVTDLKRRYRAEDSACWKPELDRIFGGIDLLESRDNDLFALADKAVKSEKELPAILSICGSEDFMIEDNRGFNNFMKQIQYPNYHCFEYPGSHTWDFWDKHIQDALAFFVEGKLPE